MLRPSAHSAPLTTSSVWTKYLRGFNRVIRKRPRARTQPKDVLLDESKHDLRSAQAATWLRCEPDRCHRVHVLLILTPCSVIRVRGLVRRCHHLRFLGAHNGCPIQGSLHDDTAVLLVDCWAVRCSSTGITSRNGRMETQPSDPLASHVHLASVPTSMCLLHIFRM